MCDFWKASYGWHVRRKLMLCSVSKLRELSIWWRLFQLNCKLYNIFNSFTHGIWLLQSFRSSNIFTKKKSFEKPCVIVFHCKRKKLLTLFGNHIFPYGWHLPKMVHFGPWQWGRPSHWLSYLLQRAWGGTSITKGQRCLAEILKRTSKRYQDPVLWVWHEMFSTSKRYQF